MLTARAVVPANTADTPYRSTSRLSADNDRNHATKAVHTAGGQRRVSNTDSGTPTPFDSEEPAVEAELGSERSLD